MLTGESGRSETYHGQMSSPVVEFVPRWSFDPFVAVYLVAAGALSVVAARRRTRRDPDLPCPARVTLAFRARVTGPARGPVA